MVSGVLASDYVYRRYSVAVGYEGHPSVSRLDFSIRKAIPPTYDDIFPKRAEINQKVREKSEYSWLFRPVTASSKTSTRSSTTNYPLYEAQDFGDSAKSEDYHSDETSLNVAKDDDVLDDELDYDAWLNKDNENISVGTDNSTISNQTMGLLKGKSMSDLVPLLYWITFCLMIKSSVYSRVIRNNIL